MSGCFQEFVDGLDRLAADLSQQSRLSSAMRDSEFAAEHADDVCRIEETLQSCERNLDFIEAELERQEASVSQVS